MPDKLTDAQVLTKAASYMQKHGHAIFVLQDGEGRVCLAGAINAALTNDPCEWPARTDKLLGSVAKFLKLKKHRSQLISEPAIAWNNDLQRTKKEVVQALRGTANAL